MTCFKTAACSARALAIALSCGLGGLLTPPAAATTLSYGAVFQTAGQTPFGSVDYDYRFRTSWERDGASRNVACYLIIGCFGGEVAGSTVGNVGLDFSLSAHAGSLGATVGTQIDLRPALDGRHLTIGSNWRTEGMSFNVQQPRALVDASFDFRTALAARMVGCVFSCFTILDGLIFDVSMQRDLLRYDSAGTLQVLGFDLTHAVGGGVPIPIGVNGYTVGRVRPYLLGGQTSSVTAGAGAQQLGFNGASVGLLDVGLDLTKMAAAFVPGMPPLNYSDIVTGFSYNLAKVELGESFGLDVDYTLRLAGLNVDYHIDELDLTISGTVGTPVEWTLPDDYTGALTITPTFRLANPLVDIDLDLEASAYLDLSAGSLYLFRGFGVGPVVNTRLAIPIGSIDVLTRTGSLGGFGVVTGESFMLEAGGAASVPAPASVWLLLSLVPGLLGGRRTSLSPVACRARAATTPTACSRTAP